MNFFRRNRPETTSSLKAEESSLPIDNSSKVDDFKTVIVDDFSTDDAKDLKPDSNSNFSTEGLTSLVVSIAESVEEIHIADGSIIVTDECFEIIEDREVAEAKPKSLEAFDKALEDAISRLKEVTDISEKDVQEITYEIRHLEEKLHLWREVRERTIYRLREIADYIDSIGKKTGFARIVGSSGGIIAGSLTIAGGVMTVMTAGAAAPVLVAGAGIGLASGLTGGAATITKKILASKQMKEEEV
ncbi:uncharacterized protein LOC111712970 [Eurytemora carolleeae]|uniref:uncharacterized protein LOC111712970 n=1 Tax=Eurytemora carolleeae TaxID=1294199 RepID=UPI000C7615D2|nr:uncharacterized protein LOC111712970 [Eurytemora carolleeae]|eukprot:XP_023343504.1 uncharacterized protein LOC111712970 [Eurytemora affinis]